MLKIFSPDKKIATKKIAEAVCKVLNQTDKLTAEIIFVSKQEIKELNARTRGVDSVTDVLSFPTLEGIRGKVISPTDFKMEREGKWLNVGSIALCEDKIKEQAKEIGHGEIKERTYLIIHGLMHLFGYDHMTETDKKQMRDKEKSVLALLEIE